MKVQLTGPPNAWWVSKKSDLEKRCRYQTARKIAQDMNGKLLRFGYKVKYATPETAEMKGILMATVSK